MGGLTSQGGPYAQGILSRNVLIAHSDINRTQKQLLGLLVDMARFKVKLMFFLFENQFLWFSRFSMSINMVMGLEG